jgi:cytochrome c6
MLGSALLSSASPAFAADADLLHGQQLFQANCNGCHAGGQNFMSEKKTLKQEAIRKYRGTLEQPEIQSFVQTKMPHKLLPFSQSFSDQEYLDVTSYVLDQAVGDKW